MTLQTLAGRHELTIYENGGENAFAGNGSDVAEAIDRVIAGTPNTGDDALVARAVNRYTFSDDDAGDGFRTWRLEGDDAAKFTLVQTVGRLLQFKESPDFENPGDRDGDNVYKVTVVATDRADARAEFEVCITVVNLNEFGKVTLYDSNDEELVQPVAQQTIVAEVTDPDGGYRLEGSEIPAGQVVSWEWSRHPNPAILAGDAATTEAFGPPDGKHCRGSYE